MGVGKPGWSSFTTSSTKLSTLVSMAARSPSVRQPWGQVPPGPAELASECSPSFAPPVQKSYLFSSFPKQLPSKPLVPPSNLAMTFWVQTGSTATPSFSALLWHFKRPCIFLLAHLFLPAKHLFGP